jgi:hypothetical protein
MERSFAMTRAQVVDADAAALKAAIITAAGSELGAESILRSLERIGTDPSIEGFEMTEVRASRRYGESAISSWRVRADRGNREEEM